jgi:hypothetical protein
MPSRPAVLASAGRPLAELVSTPSAARLVVRPADVGGPVAWQVLVRDGVLHEVVPGAACAAGTSVGPGLRAALVASRVPSRAIVTARTAAWIHTGSGTSEVLDLACSAGRHRPDRPPGARLWQAPLLLPDTVRVGPLRVTDLTRTVVELVLHDGDEHLVVALARHGADLVAARRAVQARPRAATRAVAMSTLATATARLRSEPLPSP